MSKPFTRDRGPFRILIDPTEERLDQNQYFEVEIFDGSHTGTTYSEIIYVRSARLAYNQSLRKYGKRLCTIRNLETGKIVVREQRG